MGKRKLTPTQRLQQQNANAVRTMKQLRGKVGSPYRIQEAIQNKGKPKPNK